jgi:hypothetical protein
MTGRTPTSLSTSEMKIIENPMRKNMIKQAVSMIKKGVYEIELFRYISFLSSWFINIEPLSVEFEFLKKRN